MPEPIVALYARVSTDDQSVGVQLRDLREFCSRRGWKIAQEYVDQGVSGAKDSRPAWNQCFDGIQKGRINILLVHALDRLGRSLPHLVKILATLTERGVTLVSYRENIDLSTAAGRMMAGFFSVLAEYELSMIRERTCAGMRAARARGKQIGGVKRFFDKRRATELRDAGWGQNIVLYLRDDVIHVKIVVATALMAVARKVIILDFDSVTDSEIMGLALVVVATAIAYWIVHTFSDQASEDRSGEIAPPEPSLPPERSS